MLINSWATTRFATPCFGVGAGVASMRAVEGLSTAHAAAVSTYKPFIDARNGAQGGAAAWSPPI
jgi:hypothetical protein